MLKQSEDFSQVLSRCIFFYCLTPSSSLLLLSVLLLLSSSPLGFLLTFHYLLSLLSHYKCAQYFSQSCRESFHNFHLKLIKHSAFIRRRSHPPVWVVPDSEGRIFYTSTKFLKICFWTKLRIWIPPPVSFTHSSDCTPEILFSVTASMELLTSPLTVPPPSPLSFRNLTKKLQLHWYVKSSGLRMLLLPLTPNPFLLSHWKIVWDKLKRAVKWNWISQNSDAKMSAKSFFSFPLNLVPIPMLYKKGNMLFKGIFLYIKFDLKLILKG